MTCTRPPLGSISHAVCKQNRPWLVEQDEEAADRQTASLAGVAITLLLLVVGLFLVHELHAKVAIEDCLMAGRMQVRLAGAGHLLAGPRSVTPPPTD